MPALFRRLVAVGAHVYVILTHVTSSVTLVCTSYQCFTLPNQFLNICETTMPRFGKIVTNTNFSSRVQLKYKQKHMETLSRVLCTWTYAHYLLAEKCPVVESTW